MAAVAGFNADEAQFAAMQCHFCEREADVVVERDGVRVGVCEAHFREQLDELADTDWLEAVETDLDLDGLE